MLLHLNSCLSSFFFLKVPVPVFFYFLFLNSFFLYPVLTDNHNRSSSKLYSLSPFSLPLLSSSQFFSYPFFPLLLLTLLISSIFIIFSTPLFPLPPGLSLYSYSSYLLSAHSSPSTYTPDPLHHLLELPDFLNG